MRRLVLPRASRILARGCERAWVVPAALLWTWLALLAFVVPLDPDEAVYRAITSGIIDGHWPYRDLFDHKPPLMYAWYLPTALGAPIVTERLIAATAVVASFPAVASLSRRWFRADLGGRAVWGYASLLANPFLGLGANAEAFMLLPLTNAFAAGSPASAGALLGIAVMTKPVALAFLPLFLVLWRRESWRCALGLVLVVGASSAAFLPVWREYWDANVAFNLRYGAYLGFSRRLVGLVVFNPFVALGTLPAWYLVLRGAMRKPRSILLLWLACALLATQSTGYGFGHYYALLTPPAGLLIALGTEQLPRVARRALLPALTVISLALVGLTLTLIVTQPQDAMIEAIRETDGELYVLGDRAQLYADAGRQPQRKYFYSVPLVVDTKRGTAMRAELLRCPPAVLVVPERNVFPVPWASDLATAYGERLEFAGGVVYRRPYSVCTDEERSP